VLIAVAAITKTMTTAIFDPTSRPTQLFMIGAMAVVGIALTQDIRASAP